MDTRTRVAALSAGILWLLAAAPASAAGEDAEVSRLVAELGLRESAVALRDRPGWAPPRKVVLMGADAERVAWMREAAPGVEVVGAPDRAAAAREAADADALIGECVPEVIAAGKRLRWVQRMFAGVERCVTIPAFAERGIVLTNMQKVAGSVMAEHVLAFVFGLTRGLASYVPAQAKGEWADEAVPESRLWEVKGRTLLVVGLGGIGTEVAKRAHALGMTVIATRNSGTDGPDYVSEVGLPDKLLPFASRADVIVSTLPLTPETKGLMDRRFFDAAKRGALFVNVGRGGTVVTDDLVAALADGRLGGAGLDVTDPEPLPPGHPLWKAPNVIITPHVAAGLEGNDVPRWILARENLRRYASGGKLLSEVDVKKGY
jgi:phosphoglycerate dehydrogenase-like enzyme